MCKIIREFCFPTCEQNAVCKYMHNKNLEWSRENHLLTRLGHLPNISNGRKQVELFPPNGKLPFLQTETKDKNALHIVSGEQKYADRINIFSVLKLPRRTVSITRIDSCWHVYVYFKGRRSPTDRKIIQKLLRNSCTFFSVGGAGWG